MDQDLDKKLIATIAQDSTLFAQSLRQVDEDFFQGPYRKIYSLLAAYYKKHKKLPSYDLFEEQLFKRSTKIFGENVQPDSFIHALRSETVLTELDDFDFLVEDLKKRKSLTVITEAIPEAVQAANADNIEEAAELLINAGRSMKASLTQEQMYRTSNHDYIDEVLARCKEAQESPEKVWGFKTGFARLDAATYGLDRGEMFLISARPGNGKSMFLLSVALNMFKAGHNVLYVSIEMPALQMWHRASACYTGFEINAIKEGSFASKEEASQFEQLMRDFQSKTNRFEILDAPKVTPGTITTILDQMVDEHKPDVMFIDYLGIMSPDEKGLQDNLAQKSVVEGLREIARVKKIGIFSAAQLNRPEKGKKKVAGLERLARTDLLGATVDCAVSIEEFDIEEEMTKLSDRIRIFVIKNRKGEFPFSFDVKKDFARGRFVDWAAGVSFTGAASDISKVINETTIVTKEQQSYETTKTTND